MERNLHTHSKKSILLSAKNLKQATENFKGIFNIVNLCCSINICGKVTGAAKILSPLLRGPTLSYHNKMLIYNTCILPNITMVVRYEVSSVNSVRIVNLYFTKNNSESSVMDLDTFVIPLSVLSVIVLKLIL